MPLLLEALVYGKNNEIRMIFFTYYGKTSPQIIRMCLVGEKIQLFFICSFVKNLEGEFIFKKHLKI